MYLSGPTILRAHPRLRMDLMNRQCLSGVGSVLEGPCRRRLAIREECRYKREARDSGQNDELPIKKSLTGIRPLEMFCALATIVIYCVCLTYPSPECQACDLDMDMSNIKGRGDNDFTSVRDNDGCSLDMR